MARINPKRINITNFEPECGWNEQSGIFVLMLGMTQFG